MSLDKGDFWINIDTVLLLQVVVYFGRDGRSSNTPFINLLTIGNCPNGIWLFSKHSKDDNMLLAVFIELYDKPALNKSDKNCRASGNDGETQSH